jgi:hypothetical protein
MSCLEAKEKRMDPRGVGGADFLRIKKLDPPLREKAKKKGMTFGARISGPSAAGLGCRNFACEWVAEDRGSDLRDVEKAGLGAGVEVATSAGSSSAGMTVFPFGAMRRDGRLTWIGAYVIYCALLRELTCKTARSFFAME